MCWKCKLVVSILERGFPTSFRGEGVILESYMWRRCLSEGAYIRGALIGIYTLFICKICAKKFRICTPDISYVLSQSRSLEWFVFSRSRLRSQHISRGMPPKDQHLQHHLRSVLAKWSSQTSVSVHRERSGRSFVSIVAPLLKITEIYIIDCVSP